MTPESTLDLWERRLEVFSTAIPYLVLVVSLALTVVAFDTSVTRGSLTGTLALGLFTGLWMVWWVTLHPAWRGRHGLMAVYFVGLMVLYAVLQYRAPLFGFFSFAGYVHALALLPGRWAFAGVGATGVIAATALSGGRPPTSWSDVPSFLLPVGIIVGLAVTFSFLGYVTTEQSHQRKQTVATLAELNAQLREAMEENAGLHAQLLTQAREAGILDERQRMAREIHDTLAQGLAGIITQVQAASRLATGRPTGSGTSTTPPSWLARACPRHVARCTPSGRSPWRRPSCRRRCRRWCGAGPRSTRCRPTWSPRARRGPCTLRSRSCCCEPARRRWPTWPSTPARPGSASPSPTWRTSPPSTSATTAWGSTPGR